jgi:hypothetical protein
VRAFAGVTDGDWCELLPAQAHLEEPFFLPREQWAAVPEDFAGNIVAQPEPLAGGRDPAGFDHLFTTVQSFNAPGLFERFCADYWDYAVVDECHHVPAPAGRRYIQQQDNGWRFLLCVRPTTQDAFTYLGPDLYQRHTGSRPMSITWDLEVPIPGTLLQQYATLAPG